MQTQPETTSLRKGEIATLWKVAAVATGLDVKLKRAREADFQALTEPDYLEISTAIRDLINENFFRSADSIYDAILAVEEVTKGALAREQLSHSELRKWLATFIEGLKRGTPKPKKQPKTLTPNRKLEASKKLNKKIIITFEEGQSADEIFEEIERLINDNEEVIDLINLSTILSCISVPKNQHKVIMTSVPMPLMQLIAQKIKESEEKISAFSVGLSLFGLKNLDAESVTTELLTNIAEKIRGTREPFTAVNLGLSFYGLRNLDETVIPSELLEALEEKIKRSPDYLENPEIVMGLYGLLNLQKSPIAHRIRETLFSALKNLKGLTLKREATIMAIQAFHLCRRPVPDWLNKVYRKLMGKMEAEDTTTRHERRATAFLQMRHPELLIVTEHFIDGFELDIYLPAKKINIELDGPYHVTEKHTDKRRDDYLLTRRGIKTIRIELLADVVHGLEKRLDRIEL